MANPKAKTPTKIPLKFDDLDQMLEHAASILNGGYSSRGNWTLGQTCSHIADWARYPIDGFPNPPMFIRAMLWVMKVTVGPGLKRKILAEGFSGGMMTAPESVVDPAAMSDEQGLEKLQSTINRVRSYSGELHPSPLFGEMDHETLTRVTLLHADHHFGYLSPTNN